jgi:serine/threonine protein kinase
MATPVATVPEYCTLLTKSKLLPAEEVESLYRKWKDEAKGRDDQVDSFRKFLVSRRCLTEYQAAFVQRGRIDGFFMGGYKILDRIGKGQMGGVYKAVHTFGQLVALKILPASRAKDQHMLGRFQREARLLTQLDHPNVVRAFQVGESGGVHYIVMEYLEGETLNETLDRRKRLPVPEAARLVCQALDGLQHLHDKRMVHRDLKPANLMLTPELAKGKPDTTWEATIKILDIGLGRELFDEDTPEGQIETQLTADGAVLGTPDYLAPEQAKDARSADVRADIYSLGCVFYHCLTGRPPFPDTNIMAQMLKHATEKPVPLAAILEVPAGLQQVLDKFLAKHPDDRYSTPAEAAAALRPFVGSGGAAPTAAKMVQAYKDWLESESGMEIPKEVLASTAPSKPAPAPAIQPTKPVTIPAPAVVAPTKPAPVKSPTAPAPAVRSAPQPRTPPAPAPVPVSAPGPAPAPVAKNRPPAPDEVEVELVTELSPAASAPAIDRLPERQLWPPDRRDWLMLTIGAAGVLAAVGLGYGLAKVLRRTE